VLLSCGLLEYLRRRRNDGQGTESGSGGEGTEPQREQEVGEGVGGRAD
jgi:hypothetical protein